MKCLPMEIWLTKNKLIYRCFIISFCFKEMIQFLVSFKNQALVVISLWPFLGGKGEHYESWCTDSSCPQVIVSLNMQNNQLLFFPWGFQASYFQQVKCLICWFYYIGYLWCIRFTFISITFISQWKGLAFWPIWRSYRWVSARKT